MTSRQQALLEEQRRLVERIPPGVVQDLVECGLRLIRRLLLAMRNMAPNDYETALTRTKTAQALAMIQALGERYGVEVAEAIERVIGVGAEDGRRIVNMQIEALVGDGLLPDGSAPATSDNAGELLSDSLLEVKEASRKAYGDEAIREMKRTLAEGAANNETLNVTTDRMAERVGLSTVRAERIVRTEHSFALHNRQLADFLELFGDERDDWRKQLVATLDDRTGLDSVFVNGQSQKLDRPFRDNEGRVYMMPPNRPNDREVVVFIPAPAPG